MHENRETSEAPAVKPGSRSAGEGDSRTARMYVPEESHNGVVPMNYSNNDKTSSAESGEGRRVSSQRLVCTAGGESRQGKSQKPCSLDSREERNQLSEAYRQSHR